MEHGPNLESAVSANPASDPRCGHLRCEAMSPSDRQRESDLQPPVPQSPDGPMGSDETRASSADPDPPTAAHSSPSAGANPGPTSDPDSGQDQDRDDQDDTTRILDRLAQGDAKAADELLPLVYEELRSLASACMRSERRDHTLQPTAIVHEAYIRLVQADKMRWQGRAHFMAVAAAAIRRVLIDHARRVNAIKRGGDQVRIAMDDHLRVAKAPNLDLLDLNESLERLAAMNPRQSRIVELRFFGGLTNEEVAQVMGLSRATVSDEWAFARAWLARELEVKEA